MNQSSSQKQSEALSEEDVKKLIKAKLTGKLARLPYAFWRCETGKEHSRIAIKYLIEEHLMLNLEEVPRKIASKTFQ